MYLKLKENRPHGTTEYPYTQYHIHQIRHPFQIPVHWHDELEIIYVRRGPLHILIDGKEYTGIDNSVFFVAPGLLHLMGASTPEIDYFTVLFPLEFLSFQTTDRLEQELFAPLRNQTLAFPVSPGTDSNLQLQGEISGLLEQILALNRHKKNGCLQQLNTRILLLQLFSLLLEHQLFCPILSSNTNRMQKELISYIQQNYCSRISLQELAGHFHLSEKYISRYFREHFHLTLSQYLTYLRLSHAKHLLETTDLPITTVALQSGFPNVSYFIRTFKTHFETSPLKYRNSRH